MKNISKIVLSLLMCIIFLTPMLGAAASTYDTTLSEEEKIWLDSIGSIRMGSQAGLYPFSFIGEKQGKLSGIVGDYVAEIETNIKKEFAIEGITTLEDGLNKLKSGELDIFSCVMNNNDVIDSTLSVIPYTSAAIVIYGNENTEVIDSLAKVSNELVLTTIGHKVGEWVKEDYPTIKIEHVQQPQEAMARISAGENVLYLDDRLSVNEFLKTRVYPNVKVFGETSYEYEFVMVVRKDSPALLSILQNQIYAISEDKGEAIKKLWSSYSVDIEISSVALWIFIWILIIYLIFHLYRRSVKKVKNNERTARIEAMDKYLFFIELKGDEIIQVSTALSNLLESSKESFVGCSHSETFNKKAAEDFILEEGIDVGGMNDLLIYEQEKRFILNVVGNEDTDKDGESKLIILDNITDNLKLQELSIRDGLTGLFNRRYFIERFSFSIDELKNNSGYFALAILDVDNFKLYNDNYGHDAGDKVLRSISKSMQIVNCDVSKTVFRLGGEEFGFLILSNRVELIESEIEASRLAIENLGIEHIHSECKVVTVSVGAIILDNSSLDERDRLYIQADKALYDAKETGRNKVVTYNRIK